MIHQALPLLKAAYDRGINTVSFVTPPHSPSLHPALTKYYTVGYRQRLFQWTV